MFARLAVNVPSITNLFDYSIPAELVPHIQAGCLVTAPFGNQTVQGIIVQLLDSPSVENPKPIIDLLDPAPVLTPPQLALAILLAESHAESACIHCQPDAAHGVKSTGGCSVFRRRPVDRRPCRTVNSSSSNRLLKLLNERGPLRGRQIDSHFAKIDWRKTAQVLVKKGILSSKHVLPAPRVRPKYLRVAQLSVPPEEAEAAMPNLGTKQTLARRQAALRFLIQQPEAINLSWVYAETGCNLADLQELEERDLIRLFESEIFRDPLENIGRQINRESATQALELTPEQALSLKRNYSRNRIAIPHSSFLIPHFWHHWLWQNRNLPPRRRRDHQTRQASNYPRARDRVDSASGAPFSLALSWAGGTGPLETFRRGAVRYVAARAFWKTQGHHRRALCIVHAIAKRRLDRCG